MKSYILTGAPTFKPLRRYHRGWDRAWGVIAATFGDTACAHEGESWQYMGTYGTDDNRVVHEFRHRALPPDGLRTTYHVPAETDDWTNARDPTADDFLIGGARITEIMEDEA